MSSKVKSRDRAYAWALAALSFVMAINTGFIQAAEPAAFSGERAMELLIEQTSMGPRTPGSVGNLELRELIITKARQSGLKVQTHIFTSEMPLGNSPVELCNVIVSAGPEGSGAGPRLWLGAHFDTRPISDKDPDILLREKPLVGANDGASGVAVLLHLMELLAQKAPAVGVDLLFFDGEDSGINGSPNTYCIGSQRLASTLGDFSNPLSGLQCEGLILLDMIGDRDLLIPMEGYSARNAPAFTEKVFKRATDLGLSAFSTSVGPSVYDDHVPFLQQGIPAVDLIDFQFPHWHTTADIPENCSAASLYQVGTLVTDLVYNR